MKQNVSKLFVGLAAFLMIIALAETDYGQRRTQRPVYSKQQIEQLLERIEERSDHFANQINKSLDRSRLNGTRTEDNITRRISDLENVADKLRREFDHGDTRGETSVNVRKVLRAAPVVNPIITRRNFSAQAEASWVRLRSELNTLASIYRLPPVGSKSYR